MTSCSSKNCCDQQCPFWKQCTIETNPIPVPDSKDPIPILLDEWGYVIDENGIRKDPQPPLPLFDSVWSLNYQVFQAYEQSCTIVDVGKWVCIYKQTVLLVTPDFHMARIKAESTNDQLNCLIEQVGFRHITYPF